MCVGNCCFVDGNDILEFGFEYVIEVFVGIDCYEGVRVCEGGKDINFVK